MTHARNRLNYEQLSHEVEQLLQGYGQHIALRNIEPGSQYWGTPEVALAAAAVAIWLLQTIGKTVIDHLIKAKLDSKSAASTRELEERVQRLEALNEQLLKTGKTPDASARLWLNETASLIEIHYTDDLEKSGVVGTADEAALIKYLREFGLTNRIALSLVPCIRKLLPPARSSSR